MYNRLCGGGRLIFCSKFSNLISMARSMVGIVYIVLSVAYAIVAVVALVQTILIQFRVRRFRCTPQKLFHFMNFVVCGARAIIFGFHSHVFALKPRAFTVALVELPGLLFLSAYTLIVLIWAQIYYQARRNPSIYSTIRPAYLLINAVIYVTKVCIWIFMWRDGNNFWLEVVGTLFVVLASFIAALGFLVYGRRLFSLLRSLPLEGRRRMKKLHEIRCVTAICFTCLIIRSCFVYATQINVIKNHPLLDLLYYTLVEIIPSGLVLFILGELPPKRMPSLYQPLLPP